MCLFKFTSRENDLSQGSHLKSLWPSWIAWMCFFRYCAPVNDLPQESHLWYFLLPWTVLMWHVKFVWNWKDWLRHLARQHHFYQNKTNIFIYSEASERILNWVGRKKVYGAKKIFCGNFLSSKRAFPQILGRQPPTLPTRVRRPCILAIFDDSSKWSMPKANNNWGKYEK